MTNGPETCGECRRFIHMYEMPASVYGTDQDYWLGRCPRKQRCLSSDDATRCPDAVRKGEGA